MALEPQFQQELWKWIVDRKGELANFVPPKYVPASERDDDCGVDGEEDKDAYLPEGLTPASVGRNRAFVAYRKRPRP